MLLNRLSKYVAMAVALVITSLGSSLAQPAPQQLPTGMSITPAAARGTSTAFAQS